MAFQNLRTGSTVYIFHKDNSPKLEIGQVIAEPKIRQKYPIPTPGQPYAGFMPQQQEQVVDLSIKIGDKVQPIEGLTPSTDIQDCGNGLFVSCNRDAVNAEVAAYMHNSEVAIADDVINAQKKCIEAQRSSWNLSKMKFLSQKSLMSATVAAVVMAVAQVVTAMTTMTYQRK